MHIEELRDYCIAKKGVTEEFPFDDVTLVFKVMGKVFAIVGLEKWEKDETTINLKCDPAWALELRSEYESINPGYHMNKKHWNTVTVNSVDVSDDFIKELISHSYQMVVKGFTKKMKNELEAL